MLSHELVVETYKGLLSRLPENQDVIDIQLQNHSGLSDLLVSFYNSSEFRQRAWRSLVEVLATDSKSIQVDGTPEQMKRLFEITREQWKALGEVEPYWSVISDKNFRVDDFKSNEDSFWKSGEFGRDLLNTLIKSHDVQLEKNHCLEVGVGVGRMTRFLAEEFDLVTGVDISPGNLKIAKNMLNSREANFTPFYLSSPQELLEIKDYDTFLSFLVLQHNSPPIQKVLLSNALKNLLPGGVALFQLPVAAPGYQFELEKYLDEEPGQMDMHCLPLTSVLGVLLENSVDLIDMQIDTMTDGFGLSVTFFGVKK